MRQPLVTSFRHRSRSSSQLSRVHARSSSQLRSSPTHAPAASQRSSTVQNSPSSHELPTMIVQRSKEDAGSQTKHEFPSAASPDATHAPSMRQPPSISFMQPSGPHRSAVHPRPSSHPIAAHIPPQQIWSSPHEGVRTQSSPMHSAVTHPAPAWQLSGVHPGSAHPDDGSHSRRPGHRSSCGV